MNGTSWSGYDSTAALLPLVIGVTGHRDLRTQDIDELTSCVRAIFKEIKRDYPHVPLVMLSPLADGADRLVARIAKDEFSARLVVTLPMPRDLYEKDFNETSLSEFNKLIDGVEWFELPIVEDATEEDIREYGPTRDKQYALVGQYIVEHTQILIALWDGKKSDKVGGTAQTVALKLKAVPEYYGSLPDPVECGFVYHLVTPRQSEPGKLEPRLAGKRFPDGFENEVQAGASYEELYALVDQFNEDAFDLHRKLSSLREDSRKYSYPDDDKAPLPVAAKVTRERYIVADTLAIHFQRKMLSALKQLHVLVFVAAVLFELFAHLDRFLPTPWDIPWSLLLYVAVWLAAYVWIYHRARREDYQNKYQDYRALAEGMRVQFFWGLAGLHDSVADRYLRKQRSEIRWIRLAIRVWSFLASIERRASGSELIGKAQIQTVINRWVEDQHEFFSNRTARDKKELECFEREVARLLWVGLGLAILMFLLYAVKPLLHHLQVDGWAREWIEAIVTPTEDDRMAHHIIIVLMGLAPVGAALLHNYAHKKALSEHVKEYKRMTIIFDKYRNGLQTLADSGSYSAAQVLIRELGEEALMENGDWLHLHRERPLEVPHG